MKSKKGPDELLGELFGDVQTQQIYADGKTFVDLTPKNRIRSIKEEYKLLKTDPHFDLREFVSRHFTDLAQTVSKKDPFAVHDSDTAEEHITRLWEYLERRNRVDRGSLIALPHKYIVPGGRFNEQFYWDSYFIMLGLAAQGEWKKVEDILKNTAYMIRKYGYVPTANRTYFLSRSQPPFFVMMIKLLAEHKGKKVIRYYLPQLLTEYRFWMKGRRKLEETEHNAYRRVVQLSDKSLLNRYYDNKVTARPESLREDIETAKASGKRIRDRLFLHLRAAAESGWDFSSRWLADPNDLKTIHTADIIPVDLNSLMYLMESTIADGYNSLLHPLQTRRFKKAAAKRKDAIHEYLWDEDKKFYLDYNFHHQKNTTVFSLAGVFPLYAGIAGEAEAADVAVMIQREFLKPGGVVTTLIENGQQWDSPNGWAPLQWITIQGLRRYGYNELADIIAHRWIELNDAVFMKTHRMVEKYNVMGGSGLGGGGEYVLQDGFGWTNGVYLALKKELKIS
ncbi:MAG: alpha,alpha-trehalase TreF [Candidatus Microsaccharimonas sossegonensis]|uniref:Alpha,alpha-trehalase TreF n=1 Tax=Candidatus Microsaccharimonas sossegonensis TaxID=2506948 RepID=A0A4Q0AGF9_9BACT|nr:MAG: alpha,alpha-trehalase TreF [Candidatus Microsaccharimonas sossegonensis]